jgi:hypothetical protein
VCQSGELRLLTNDEAVAIMCEATQKVDWVNLGRVFSTLGEYGFTWGNKDKSRFYPNFERAFRDRVWLANNGSALKEAIETLKKNRNAL